MNELQCFRDTAPVAGKLSASLPFKNETSAKNAVALNYCSEKRIRV